MYNESELLLKLHQVHDVFEEVFKVEKEIDEIKKKFQKLMMRKIIRQQPMIIQKVVLNMKREALRHRVLRLKTKQPIEKQEEKMR